MLREAKIVINGVELNFTQSMVVRVAVSSMLMSLADREYSKALGKELAEGYRVRLKEIEDLIFISL